MNDDMELVREYAARQSEKAFETLVARHISLVHAAALRQVRDPGLAEDITQTVFIILAQKAGSLGSETILPGWLYRTTRYVSSAALKINGRRERREQEAQMLSTTNEEPTDSVWAQLAPVLDDAMTQLGARDRDALVLRYFQDKSLREVGAILGLDESAAQKRVGRALEKLRGIFARRGLVFTTAAIAGAVSASSAQASPALVTKSVAAAALVKGAAGNSSTLPLIKGALKLMAWTQAKTAIGIGVGVLLLAGTATVTITTVQKPRVTAHRPWTNVGAATPKAALQTLLWALNSDQIDRAQELMQWEITGESPLRPFKADPATLRRVEQELTLKGLAVNLKNIKSFRVISTKSSTQPDYLLVNVDVTFIDGSFHQQKTVKVRHVGSRWYVFGKIENVGNNISTQLPFFLDSKFE